MQQDFRQTRTIAGTFLLLAAFGVAVFHVLLSAFCYVVRYQDYTPALRWTGLVLLVASVLYLLFSAFFSKSPEAAKVFFRRFFSFEQMLLVGLLFWFFLSCAINQAAMGFPILKTEDWLLFDSTICFLLLFPLTVFFPKEKSGQMVEVLIHIVVILYTVFTMFCLWHIFNLEVVTLPSGEQAGMTKSVQLMLGLHYNITGMIAATMFCLCVFMVCTQELPIRILYIFFSLVQLVVIYLCNSRTVFVAVLVFVAVVSFFFPWTMLLKKDKPLLRFVVCALICFFCSALFWVGRTGMFILFEKITHFSEELAKEAGNLAAPFRNGALFDLSARSQHDVLLLAESGAGNARKLTDLSNRTEVWKAAIKVLGTSPRIFFFGVTPDAVSDAIWLLGGYHHQRVAHAHNIFLQLGVSMGVPAMILFIVFLVSVAVRSFRILFSKSKNVWRFGFLIPSSVLCFVLIDMAEVYLITRFSVISCFFFLFCGWIVSQDREARSAIKQNTLSP